MNFISRIKPVTAFCLGFVALYLSVHTMHALAADGDATDTNVNTAQALSSPELIERGRYLTTVAGCYACHTKDPDKPFAGGDAIRTPFGLIYPPNITPDAQTGIGLWSDEAMKRFARLYT